MRSLRCTFLFPLALMLNCAFGQHVEVNNQNKTIAVSADATVTADAEIAILHIGYHNFAANKDDAFKQNATVANSITQKLIAAGVMPAQIESTDLSLNRAEPDEK